MKRFFRHPAFIWCVRLVVAAVLIYAALQKIRMPLEFARLIRKYHLPWDPANRPDGAVHT